MDKFELAAVGCFTIAGIEIAALLNGINGTGLSLAVGGIGAIIAGSLGFKFGKGD